MCDNSSIYLCCISIGVLCLYGCRCVDRKLTEPVTSLAAHTKRHRLLILCTYECMYVCIEVPVTIECLLEKSGDVLEKF